MALVRRTLDHVRRVKLRIDRGKIDSTTEADIRRHMILTIVARDPKAAFKALAA
jgi:hypothetical protein